MKLTQPMAASAGVSIAWADVSAATLSFLCLLHCAALPLILPLLPLAGQIAGNETVHKVLVGLAVPISLTVLLVTLTRAPGARAWWLAVLLLSGVSMLVLALVEPFAAYERSFTVAGSLMLATAHLWHWRQTRLLA